MTRGEHRIDSEGRCERCGLPDLLNGGRCPPGFWMTEAEIAIWDEKSPRVREAMEKNLASQRQRDAQGDNHG